MRRIIGLTIVVFLVVLIVFGCDWFWEEVETPSFTNYTLSYNYDSFHIELWYSWPEGADQLILERSVAGTNNYFELYWGEEDYHDDYGYGLTDNHFTLGESYTYRVCGYSDESGRGDYATLTVTIPPFTAPENITATSVSSSDGDYIRLTWTEVDMDDIYYKVYRADELDGSYYEMGDTEDTGGTIYEDYDDIDPGSSYYYKVSTYSTTYYAETEKSGPVAVDVNPLEGPAMVSAERTDSTTAVVVWEYEDNASYKLYRSVASPSNDDSYGPLQEDFYYPGDGGFTASGDEVTYTDNTLDADTVYYYKAQMRLDSIESTLSSNYVTADISGGSGSWTTLGSDAFDYTEDDVELVNAGGTLYLLYPDGDDTNNRIAAISHDGTDTGTWTVSGDYLSVGAADSNEVCAFSDGTNLYAGYADTGDSDQVYVKSFDGSSWSSVGNSDGVQIYDAQAWDECGHKPALTCDASSGYPFMVYPTDSSYLVNSLSYPGSGVYWEEVDSDFWSDDFISSFSIKLVTDSDGYHIAALQIGGGTSDPSIELFLYNGSAWSD